VAASPGAPAHGIVVGATIRPADYGLDLAAAGVPILAPGFGAQGARLGAIRDVFGEATDRVIANVSRAALTGGPEGLRQRLRDLRHELADGVAA